MISEEGRLWDWAHPVDTNAAAESSDAEFIASLVIPHVDRALALMDRNPSARTHGSMDRAFWYYRTLTNFQSAVWQQPMLAFAILRDYYPGPTEDFDRSVMEQATESALNAWTLCQHRNGAFDEWYLNEYSYCPTAITSAGAALTLTVSRGWLHASPRAKATQALSTSCAWLLKRYNSNVMNQNLAATVALAGLAHVSGQQEWLEGARTKLQRIADDQNKEGWLPEYGGFDFGYSTLTLDFLSIISSLGLAELADAIADRLIRFLNMVLDRGCAIPGRIGSRGTSHAFLAGAISYGRQSSQARALESLLLDLHRKRLAANPGSVDDRYFSYFYFPQFALALKAAADKRADSVSSTRDAATLPESTAHLSSSGIALHRLDRITVVQNRRLGDAFAVLRQNESPLYHLGYTAMVKRRNYSTATWNPNRKSQLAQGTSFTRISESQPLRFFAIPFHIATYLLFNGRLAELFQATIKKKMIAPTRSAPIVLARALKMEEQTCVIEDQVRPPRGGLPIDDLQVTETVTMHSPSARNDLARSFRLSDSARDTAVGLLRNGDTVLIVWKVPIEAAPAGAIDHSAERIDD